MGRERKQGREKWVFYWEVALLRIMKAWKMKSWRTVLLLGHVYFSENGFRETTSQIFLCLFTIRKGGQWKTLYSQQKTLSSQRKTWLGLQESVFPFSCVCFPESSFRENTFPNFHVFICHWKSWSTKNTLQSKKNLAWFSEKCFPIKFERKTLSGSYEKFRNVIICRLYQIWSSNFWLLYIFCFENLFFNFIS